MKCATAAVLDSLATGNPWSNADLESLQALQLTLTRLSVPRREGGRGGAAEERRSSFDIAACASWSICASWSVATGKTLVPCCGADLEKRQEDPNSAERPGPGAPARDLPAKGGWIWSKPELIDDDTKAVSQKHGARGFRVWHTQKS